MFPMSSYLGSLGLGLPAQDGSQQSAQISANQDLAGSGRKRRVGVSPQQNSGSPSASPVQQPLAAPDMPTMDVTGTGSDAKFDPMANMQHPAGMNVSAFPSTPAMGAPGDGRRAMNLDLSPNSSGTAPLPPVAPNPRLQQLRDQLEMRQDPQAVAKAQMANRGIGAKIGGGIMGALQAIGGRGGIIGGIESGVRGDDQRNRIMNQVAQQNAAHRQTILDQLQIEKEQGDEMNDQQSRDIGRANIMFQNRNLDETVADRRAKEAEAQAKQDAEGDQFRQRLSLDRNKLDEETRWHNDQMKPQPGDQYFGKPQTDDRGQGYVDKFNPDGSLTREQIGGAKMYVDPGKGRGGSRGGSEKTATPPLSTMGAVDEGALLNQKREQIVQQKRSEAETQRQANAAAANRNNQLHFWQSGEQMPYDDTAIPDEQMIQRSADTELGKYMRSPEYKQEVMSRHKAALAQDWDAAQTAAGKKHVNPPSKRSQMSLDRPVLGR